MTPAIRALDAAGIAYQVLRYQVDETTNLGVAAAAALGLDPAVVFKTLIVEWEGGHHGVVVIPAAESLDLKALGRICGTKSATLAPAITAERLTGYVIGGISPIGQKRQLPTFIDSRALSLDTLYISAGRRGLELGIASRDLIDCCQARVADLTTAHRASGPSAIG